MEKKCIKGGGMFDVQMNGLVSGFLFITLEIVS